MGTGEAISSYALEVDDRGTSYRAGAQQAAPTHGGLGWRARAAGGARARLEAAGGYRGAWGDSEVYAAHVGDSTGLRVAHAGAVGWVQGEAFAARSIEGAFALVDVGAPGVSVTRDRSGAGRRGHDGQVLVTNLRPNEANLIAVAANDLPLCHAASMSEVRIAPPEGTGVVIRFDAAVQRVREGRVRYADGAVPPRGVVLVRARWRALSDRT